MTFLSQNFSAKLIALRYESQIQSPENSASSHRLNDLIESWACKLELPECIENARTLFKGSMQNVTFNVPNINKARLSMILCTAVKYGVSTDYGLLEKDLDTDNVEHKRLLITSMGCTRDRNNLENYFSRLLNETWTPYSSDIIVSIGRNKIGKIMFLEFLYNRFESIINNIGMESILILLKSISTEFELRLVSVWLYSAGSF